MTGVFHLAVPTKDLDETEAFYRDIVGASKARRYEDRVTFNFFGDQVVFHLAPEKVDTEVSMYPRHFGFTFTNKDEFDKLYQRCNEMGATFFKDLFTRWPDTAEKHDTFFLVDPSNNLIEFKYYYDEQFIY